MKLKYTLLLLASAVCASAAADVVRFHYTEDKIGAEPTYVDYGANNFVGVRRAHNSSSGYGLDIVQFAPSHSSEMLTTYNWAFSFFFDKIEFFHAEKVGLEVDVPDMFWTPGFGYGELYVLEYTGRVYLKSDSDINTEVSGTLYVKSYPSITIPSFEWKKPSMYPTNLADSNSDSDGDMYGIRLAPLSSNVKYDDISDGSKLSYKLGGEFGTEATFIVRIPSWIGGSTNGRAIVNSNCDANSFDDMFNIGFHPKWSVSYGYDTEWRKDIEIKNGKLDSYTTNVGISVNTLVKNHGAKGKVDFVNISVDGIDIPDNEVNDYVLGERTWTVAFDSLSPETYGHEMTYKFQKLDLTKEHKIQVSYLAEVEANPGAPYWLEQYVAHGCRKDLQQVFTLKPSIDVDDEECFPNQLTIDVNKASFPDCEETEGSLAALFDGDMSTFCHSSWTKATERSEPYGSYIDMELDEPVQSIGFAMRARNPGSSASPTKVRIYCSNDAENWTLLSEYNNIPTLASGEWLDKYAKEDTWKTAGKRFKYMRWCVIESRTGTLTFPSATSFWNLSELRFFGK